MANKRMFSLKVVDTDAFLDMPQSTQMLYFHLAMRGDDDGFVANPKKIMKMLGNNEDDIRILITKKFIIAFDSGVIVIKHWRIHNLIRQDRYTPTQYTKEKEMLITDEKTKKYSLNKGQTPLCIPNDIPNGNQMVPQVRLGKVRLGNDSSIDSPQNIEEIWKEMMLPFINNTAPATIIDFENYWRQKNNNGTKELWQMQKVFDINRRLKTWIRKEEKWQHEKETRNKLKFVQEKPLHRNDNINKQSNNFNSIGDLISKR